MGRRDGEEQESERERETLKKKKKGFMKRMTSGAAAALKPLCVEGLA